MDIVFARYRESDHWIMEAVGETSCRIFVYDRGEDKLKLPVSDRLIHIEDENRGREDCVYLRHIVQNYSTIRGTIAFSQADNRDGLVGKNHYFGSIDLKEDNDPEDGMPFTVWAKRLEELERNGESPCYKSHPRARFVCDLHGNPHHPGLPLDQVWNMIFGPHRKAPEKIFFHPCAVFATSGDAIRKHDLYLYHKLHSISSSELGGSGRLSFAWCIERLWEEIFAC
jgi:hypothetical protein